jgi:hypothetical protein
MNKLLGAILACTFAVSSLLARADDGSTKPSSGNDVKDAATPESKQPSTERPQPNKVAPANYGGLWRAVPEWDSRLILTHHGKTLTATWTKYSTEGPGWTFSVTASQTAPNTFVGTLYRERSGNTSAGRTGADYLVIRRQGESLGTARFAFADQHKGSVEYQTTTYQISRLPSAD